MSKKNIKLFKSYPLVVSPFLFDFSPDRQTLKSSSIILMVFLLFLINVPHLGAMQQTKKMWSLITLTGDYKQIVYSVEPQLRLVDDKNLFQQFIANNGIGYKIVPQWQIWLGQTYSVDSQDAVPGSVDEYRLWQQIIWKRSLPSLSFISRTRFEERKSFHFPDWAYRLRERVLINRPISSKLSIVITDEIFFNIGKADWITTSWLDQNRAFIGLEQPLSKRTYLGVGYMSQYLSTPINQLNHILWLNWRIDLEHSA